TDDDMLKDGWEVLYGTNPLSPDTDKDGWSDGKEVYDLLTDPLAKGPININEDADFEAFEFEGSGSEGDPFIIENLVLSAATTDLIRIRNTRVYFVIRDCELNGLNGQYAGIALENVWYGEIHHTSIQGCANGIILTDCFQVVVDGDGGVKILGGTEASSGILVHGCEEVSVLNYIIRDFETGIDIEISSNIDISLNYVAYNNIGISLAWASNVVVHNCIITGNNRGIFVGFFSSHNSFYLNHLISNSIQKQDQSPSSEWRNSDLGLGNYWSNYWGGDADGDGVGDTSLPHEGVDQYPLVDPSIPMGHGGLPVGDDWWSSVGFLIWRGSWFQVEIQVTDPLGHVINSTTNELGMNAWYFEELQPDGTTNMLIMIVIPVPLNPYPQEVFSLEIVSLDDSIYSMEWFMSYGDSVSGIGGEVLFEREIEEALLTTGQTKLVEMEIEMTPEGVEVSAVAQYDFGGFLRPIKPDGSSWFFQNMSIPVKFQLFDETGNPDGTAHATLELAMVIDGVVGDFMPAGSTSPVDTSNVFRYDEKKEQYVFNFNTMHLAAGIYVLRITLDDGQQFTVQIEIR
ncbi:MAG: NosD domain-containing protein, partial [Candidatus Thorarchaeota archaeon]